MVKRKADRNPKADDPISVAEELYAKAFNVAREPRSLEYKRGVIAALIHRSTGIEVRKNCAYKAGTVEYDAFHAGLEEGGLIWEAYIDAPAHQEEGSLHAG